MTPGRSWFPDHLTQVREQTIRQIRPYLEQLNSYLNKSTTVNNSKARLVSELKTITVSFLLTSEEELQKGLCKKYISQVQNLHKEFRLKVEKDCQEKEFVVKLLFILSTYSRVQEYLKDVSLYMV